MSTNYYWKKVPEYFLEHFSNIDTTSDESPYLHIGKRSNAGAFCPDCGTTLCKKGTSMAHNNLSDWYDKCPCCGKIVTTGITDFMWTMFRHKYIIEELLHSEKLDVVKDKLIVDESGNELTLSAFKKIYDTPIQRQVFGWWC